MLDNMDGKHARNTGNSSPLGMLFDHGCDAITTFCISLALGSVVGLSSPFWYALLWLMVSLPFFLVTWESYYTGELNFPILHGVSEGTLFACSVFHWSGVVGTKWWLQEITVFGIETYYNHVAVVIFFSAGFYFAILSFYTVVRQYKDIKDDLFTNLFIFFFLMVSMFLNIFFSDSELIKNNPKIIVFLYGFAFAKLVGHLQLAHIADSKFMQYRKSLITSFCFLATFSIIRHLSDFKMIEIDTLIIGFLVLHFIVWIHFAYYLTEELCQILGIYRFKPGKRPKLE
jgi:ethanolaminephosphotransferase